VYYVLPTKFYQIVLDMINEETWCYEINGQLMDGYTIYTTEA